MISHFTIWVKREIDECPFSPFFMIVSDTLANVHVILLEIAKITVIGREWNFTIKNCSEK